MEPHITAKHNKQIEQSIINLSVKIANALQMIQTAKEMMNNSESVLIKALQELEELYVGLDNADENDA